MLKTDDVDLALTYDYNLAPATADRTIESTPLWSSPWGLGVPTPQAKGTTGDAPAIFRRFRDHDWIVDSRNTADETVIRTVASMAGFEPRITHQADSLNLVQDLIVAGLGVGLLPASQPTLPGVSLLPLTSPDVELRAHASTRHGRERWPPLELVMRLLSTAHLAR